MTAPNEPTAEPQPEPQPAPSTPEKPPWGDDFDAKRAWDLVQNLRGDKSQLKSDLDQAAKDRAELESLREEKMTADEKAVATARKEAATAASEAAKAEYLPQIQALQVKAAVSAVTQDEDQTNAFMLQTNPAAFFNEKGEFDQEKLMGVCTALWARAGSQPQSVGPRYQNAGQFTQPPPRSNPGTAGSAEAAKRFGSKS